MYSLYAPMWDTSQTLQNLLKNVLGYTNEEIKILESEHFGRNIVNNLTIEQAKEITEIFGDNDFQIYLNKGLGADDVVFWKELGISLNHEPPKDHYCDEPLVSREHLADLSIPKKIDKPVTEPIMVKTQSRQSFEPIVHCKYCNSTNTKKISNLSKASSVIMWGVFSKKVHKEYHCINCGADF